MDLTPLSQVTLTIIGGITIFVLGQIFMKFFIDPVQELSSAIGEAIDALEYYSNIYTNPRKPNEPQELTNARKDAQDEIRKKASLLMAKKSRVKLYGFASFFKILPKERNLLMAHGNMIGLSNSCFMTLPEISNTVDKWCTETPKLLSTKEFTDEKSENPIKNEKQLPKGLKYHVKKILRAYIICVLIAVIIYVTVIIENYYQSEIIAKNNFDWWTITSSVLFMGLLLSILVIASPAFGKIFFRIFGVEDS